VTDRTRVAITWFAFGAVAAGILTFAAYKLMSDEDRPPIVVKGGSIIFEMHPLPGQPTSPNWVDDGNGQNWKPDHPAGTKVAKFIVSVINPDGQCSRLEGNAVQLSHSAGNDKLHVNVGGQEPNVGPKAKLTADNGAALRTLRFADGDLTAVRVQNTECKLKSDSQVWIWPK
jgi:hypothetical protein